MCRAASDQKRKQEGLMMRKKVFIAAAVAALSICSAVPAMAAGWQQDARGWWYVFDSGNYAVNGWRNIDGKDYLFDADGYLVKGWAQMNGQWKYFREDGSIATGWLYDGGNWYYLDPNGNMHTGFLELGNKTYYLDANGVMAVGQREIEGQFWFFQGDGSAKHDNRAFEQNGVKYRYNKENVLERYNPNTYEWEPAPGIEESIDKIRESLRKKLVEDRSITISQFEKEAKEKLGKYLDETELEDYIEQVEWELQ